MSEPTGTPGAPAAGAPAGAPAGGAAAAAGAAPAEPKGTAAAIQAARQRIAESGSILPEDQSGAGETDEQKKAREDAAAAAGAAETDEQKAAREAAEAADQADREAHPGETDEQREARRAAETAEAEHPEWNVTLDPIEDRGEEPISIEAPDQETFDRLHRLQNEAAIGRNVRQERRVLERQQDQLEQVEDAINLDPAGFVLDRVADPVKPMVAMHLLLDPAVLEAVQARLEQQGVEGGLAGLLENPEAQRLTRAELKSERLELRDQLRTQAETRRAMRASAQQVATQIESMIPPEVQGADRETLYQEAIKDVSERCRRLGISKLEPEDVTLLVGNRFRQHGITPAEPAAGKNGKRAAVPGAPAPSGPTADQLKAARDARARAAAAAPAGVGTPAAGARPELPKDTTGRIAAARKYGLRALLGRR